MHVTTSTKQRRLYAYDGETETEYVRIDDNLYQSRTGLHNWTRIHAEPSELLSLDWENLTDETYHHIQPYLRTIVSVGLVVLCAL